MQPFGAVRRLTIPEASGSFYVGPGDCRDRQNRITDEPRVTGRCGSVKGRPRKKVARSVRARIAIRTRSSLRSKPIDVRVEIAIEIDTERDQDPDQF
jgi:hypothetical protein